jgi:MYXO-CTERM domain-containing protein
MSRALRVAISFVLVGAASPALAFVRSTTVAEQPGQGLCLYWGSRTVGYRINATSAVAPPCQDAAAAATLSAASFPAWSPSCTDFHFTNGGNITSTAVDGRDGVNLVVFRGKLCSDVPCAGNACATANNCWDHGATGTIALTTVTFVASTGQIVDADMEVYGWNGSTGGATGLPTGYYLTCATPTSPACARPPYGLTGCNYIDVGNIVTHEAGHMLGLDHTCTYPAPYNSCPSGGTTMDPTMLPGETSKRVLSADDKNGVCTIYPAGAATVTCSATPPPEPAKSGGCSTGGGGSGVLGLLGLALLLRRPGRRKSAQG